VSDGSHRSLRCSLEAAVFVGSDETIVSKNSSVFEAFRRLVLQSGVANIAGAGSRGVVAFFVVSRGRRTCAVFGWNIEVSATSTST